MPRENPYRLYATHLWELDDDYLRLFDYLGDIDLFYYVNCSDPEARPDGDDPIAEREVLAAQIGQAELVIVLAQQHYENPGLIELQLTTARRHGKPILAVEPFGPDPVPQPVRAAAAEVVEWYARKLVDGIKKHARGEDVQRFDTIDWPGDL